MAESTYSTSLLWGLSLADWATIVNAAALVVLVVINILYLRSANRQAAASMAQAKESQRQADAATESLRLLKTESEQRNAEELIRAIAILHAIRHDVAFWTPIVKDKWGMAPSTVHLLPLDWPIVVYRAGRISAELRKEVLILQNYLANANYQITEFLSAHPQFRNSEVLKPAHLNLVNASPVLTEVISKFETFEQANAGQSSA